MSEHSVYLQAIFICLALLVILFVLNLRQWRSFVFKNPLFYVYVLIITACISDLIWVIIDGIPELRMWNHLVNIIYLNCYILVGYFWFQYCLRKSLVIFSYKKLFSILFTLPALTAVIITIASAKTGWVYTINADGFYENGEFYLMQTVGYVYLVGASLLSLASVNKVNLEREKRSYQIYALFVLPPVTIGMLHWLFIPGASVFIEFSIFISLLLLYEESQSIKITKDSLTDLINKYEFDKRINHRIGKSGKDITNLYLVICDFDYLKRINEAFGYLEGDEALIIVARGLEDIFGRYEATIARLNGDKFAILFDTENEEAIKYLKSQISSKLQELCIDRNYDVSVSVGIARYEKGMTVKEFFREAKAIAHAEKKSKL